MLDLVYLRVSQLNGCPSCVDMHSKDLRVSGERNERLDCLTVWRKVPFYSAQEQAALAFAEELTHLDVSDATFEQAQSAFGEAGLVALTLAIGTINTWNRLNLAFGTEAGRYQPQAG